jgi:hypothetical protein
VAKSVILSASTLNPVSSAITGETVALTAIKTDPYATGTPVISIASGAEFVESFIDGNLIVKAGITAQNPIITLKATCDDKIDLLTLHIYIPAENIIISANGQTAIAQDGQLQLSYNILPLNSTVAKPIFTIISGAQYATVDADGLIKVNSLLGVPDADITVRATVDGKTAELDFELYVPITSVSLSADNYSPKSYKASADTVTLSAAVNNEATANYALSYVVESGAEYVESINGNVLKIKNNIAATGKSIKLRASVTDAGGAAKLSQTITLEIHIPIETLTFNITEIGRGEINQFTPTYNSNNVATTKGWIYIGKVITDANGNTISSVDGKTIEVNIDSISSQPSISVSQFTPAGTKIIVTYKASDEDGKTFSHTFIVKGLTSSNFTVQYRDFSSSQIYSGGTDSAGIELNLSAPQLETGRYVDILVKYNSNENPVDYGISYSITSNTNSASSISGNYLRLTVNSSATGSSTITYTVKIIDGSTSYSITKSIAVFRRMSGQPSISQASIVNKTTTLTKLSNTITANGTPTGYSTANLKFIAVDGSDYSLTESGVLTIKTLSAKPIVQLTMTQTYNGNNIVYTSNTISISLKSYSVYKYDGTTSSPVSVTVVNDLTGYLAPPVRNGYIFGGYYTGSSSTLLWDASGNRTSNTFSSSYSTLYPKWTAITYTLISSDYFDGKEEYTSSRTTSYGSVWTFTLGDNSDWNFEGWHLSDNSGDRQVSTASSYTMSSPNTTQGGTVKVYTVWTKKSCIATGTLITLADGTQKAVEDLDGTELLLVWNLWTGKFDYAPMIFIDSEATMTNTVINLYFSDNTSVKVITEHGFWDYDLNKYVFLRKDATEYIGHYFAKEVMIDGELVLQRVQLTNVVIAEETTGAWSPVTFGHLCYFVNGMLSMPGETESFINIFDVDPITMQYDEVQMNIDIATYGLFTYDDFADILPYEMYEAFGGAYLKISIGKGNTTLEEIYALIEYYAKFLNSEEDGEPTVPPTYVKSDSIQETKYS